MAAEIKFNDALPCINLASLSMVSDPGWYDEDLATFQTLSSSRAYTGSCFCLCSCVFFISDLLGCQ